MGYLSRRLSQYILLPVALLCSTALAAPTSRYVGVASWYGKAHQGRKMANGERFDARKLTAAMWNIALGTTVHVVNLENGKAVDVTITDRGPAHRLRRVIDLSEEAATLLDFKARGLAKVFIQPTPKLDYEEASIQ